MDSLDQGHRDFVNDFVANARELGGKIQYNKSLRDQPFSDTILRAMAINHVRSKEQMLHISGIRPEMVAAYGERYLKILHALEELYGIAEDGNEDRPYDPNHTNVIDLCSSDEGEAEEYDRDVDFEDFEAEEEEEITERSSYFAQHPVTATQSATTHTQTAAGRNWMDQYDALNTTVPKRTLPWRDDNGAKQPKSPSRRKPSHNKSRSYSGAKKFPFKANTPGDGVRKATSKKRQSGEGGSRTKTSTSNSKKGAGSGSRGIGLMPT
jgi:bloom syndrome protein